jgi:hypothetical protein
MAWVSARDGVASDGLALLSIRPAGCSGDRDDDRPLADGLDAGGRLGAFSVAWPAGARRTEIG